MSKNYYRIPIDSPTGKKISDFWQLCLRANEKAEKYVKRYGGQYYHNDPHFMAGGIVCLSFPDNSPSDPKMWRPVGTECADGTSLLADGRVIHPDGSTTTDRNGYQGPTAPGDIEFYEPAVSRQIEFTDLPSKDFRPSDTADRFYSGHPIPHGENYQMECIHLVYDGLSTVRSGSAAVKSAVPAASPAGKSTVSVHSTAVFGGAATEKTARRAIKAEAMRMKLPLIRAEKLLEILEADWLHSTDTDKPVRRKTITTPTFFAYGEHYYIGCDYPCHTPDAQGIYPNIYHSMQQRAISESTHKGS